MSDNVEKFLISLEFVDDKAVKGLKKFLQDYKNGFAKTSKEAARTLETETKKGIKSVSDANNKASKQRQTAIKKEADGLAKLNTLEQRRLALRKKIAQAKDVGVSDLKRYQGSLSMKNPEKLRQRILELEGKIFDKKQANKIEQDKINAAQAKEAAASKKAKAAQQEQFKLDKQRKREISERIKLENALSRIVRGRAYETVNAMTGKDASARDIMNRFRQAVSNKDINNVRRINNEMQQYTRHLRRAKAGVFSLANAQNRLTASTMNMFNAYVSIFALFETTRSINRVGQQFDSLEIAMLSAMGSEEAAAKQIDFLDRMTTRLGMSLIDTADSYTKFTFAAKGKLPTEEINYFFEAFSEAGTVLGLSKERMKLAMTSIQQMMNKTIVTSEDLKQQ